MIPGTAEFFIEFDQLSKFEYLNTYWDDTVHTYLSKIDSKITPHFSDREFQASLSNGIRSRKILFKYDYLQMTNCVKLPKLILFLDLFSKESRDAYNILKEVLIERMNIGSGKSY